MASTVLTTGAAYTVRTMLRNNLGLEAAGLYQSAWAVGCPYAWASSSRPWAAISIRDSPASPRTIPRAIAWLTNRLTSASCWRDLELGTLTFAPVVVSLFYHSTFIGAVESFAVDLSGMVLRVVAWPMGYIILAKGAARRSSGSKWRRHSFTSASRCASCQSWPGRCVHGVHGPLCLARDTNLFHRPATLRVQVVPCESTRWASVPPCRKPRVCQLAALRPWLATTVGAVATPPVVSTFYA